MKRLFILLTIIPLTTFCQNRDSIRIKKFSIGLTFSPDYCYRTLKPDASNKWIADVLDSFEIPRFGYTTGINVAFYFNNRISFESGILFSDKGERLKKHPLLFGNVQPNPNLPSNIMSIYHYMYFDIPVKVNYYILTHRLKLYVTAGISPNIFITAKTTNILGYSDGHTSKSTSPDVNKGYSKINLTIIAGFGFTYELTKRIYFKLEPIYRRSITTINNDPIKGYLYSAGLNVGAYFKI